MKLRMTCLLAVVGMFAQPCEAQTQPKRKTDTAVVDFLAQDLLYFNARDRVNADWPTVLSGRTIGVRVSPADSALRTHVPATQGKYGLVVTNVIKDSPAAKAGVKLHDLILSANGKYLADGKQLKSAVQKNKKTVLLSILRSGKPRKLDVRLTKPSTVYARTLTRYIAATALQQSKFMIGVNTKSADATLIKQLVLPPSTGRVITSVDAKSPAAIAGLQPHDLILRVGETYVRQSADLGKELDKAKGKSVAVEFLRAGRKQICVVTPKKRTPIRVTYDRAIADYYSLSRVLASQALMKDLKSQSPTDLKSQINKLAAQMSSMQKTLEALKKAVEASNKRKK